MSKFLVFAAVLLLCSPLHAQEVARAPSTDPAAATLPEAPGESSSDVPSSTPTTELKQPKRIAGIIPNFRSVSAGENLPPQSPREKFKTAFQDSFDYSSFIFVGIQAGISQATSSYPEFHQGAPGFARYYWHTFADTADENLQVEAIFPTLLHQDGRYYTLGHGGLIKRSTYALSRALITRTDEGNAAPNYSEIIGAGGASGISSLYYPSQYRTWTKVGQRWITNIILDSATFEVKEFWPDINQAFSHAKQ